MKRRWLEKFTRLSRDSFCGGETRFCLCFGNRNVAELRGRGRRCGSGGLEQGSRRIEHGTK